jgi:GWxTD domain-containing protein
VQQLVLEFSVRITLIAAAMAAVLWVLRIRSSVTRHAAWASVVVLMMLLPLWTAWGPKASLRLLPPQFERTGVNPRPLDLSSLGLVANMAQPPSAWQNWRGLLIGIYVLGLCILLGRLFVGTVRATRILRNATEHDGKLIHASCAAPITVGWLNPQVILPVHGLSWPQAQLDAVLVHEHEHARRRDTLIQWMALLNRAIFWFHPLAWWLERRLAALAEEACDAAVLESGHDPRAYSEYLLDIARSVMLAGGRLNVMGAAMPGSFLSTRLRKILEGRVAPRVSRPRTLCFAAVCGLTTALFAAGTLDHSRGQLGNAVVQTPQVQPKAPEMQTTTTLAQASPARPSPSLTPIAQAHCSDPYNKWLDEEAVYIISKAEREAFLRLRSDEECKQFIQQFWLRRDPTPDTQRNEYQEEHYRRIAYANDHFSFANTAGWRTDRGTIYIKFGPPDTYTARSIKPDNAAAFLSETWTYKYIDGIGNDVSMEFADTARNGEFHMTMDPGAKDAKTPADETQFRRVDPPPPK